MIAHHGTRCEDTRLMNWGARITMRSCRVLLALAVGCSMGAAGSFAQGAVPPPVVLKADRLFDAVSGKITEHGLVLVSDRKIQAVGADVKVPANARIIDLGDAT